MGRIQRYPIYYSNRLEKLAAFLGEELFGQGSEKRENFSVFQKRMVMVPGEPVRRFLTLFFASHPQYQIAAGIQWKTLSEGISELLEPGHKIPLFFELAVKIEEVICTAVCRVIPLDREEEASLQPLIEYLQGALGGVAPHELISEKGSGAIAALSRQLAQVFLHYALYGTDFLPSWLEKRGWQQWIWKRIYDEKGNWALQNGASVPFQCHVFGFHFLPKSHRDFLCGVGAIFYQLSPCAMFWEDVLGARDRIGLRRYFEKKKVKGSDLDQWEKYVRDTHPLLANWGRLGRTFLQQLDSLSAHEAYEPPLAEGVLSQVQSDFLHLRAPEIREKKGGDRSSIEVHSATSPFREVEVLYDLLLEKIQGDPSISSKEILVLSPQLDRYIPFIEAVFGAEGSAFNYSVEQIFSPSQSEGILGLLQLLEIAKKQLSAQSLLKLFSYSSFLKLWGFSSQDVRKIRRWVETAGEENTTERWLMSLIMRTPVLVEGIASGAPIPGFLQQAWPSGGLDVAEIELLNQWSILKASLEEDLRSVIQKERLSVRDWLSQIERWMKRYFGETEDQEFLLKQIRHWSGEGFEHQPVFSSDWITRWLQEMSQGSRHRGSLHQLQRVVFLPLKPGNIVPAKVIALLGMDEGAFPRRKNPFVLSEMKPAKEWIPTQLEEDRYLFLEILTLVKEALIISYERVDPKDHQHRAPSPLVQELLMVYPEVGQIDHPAFPFEEKQLSTERFYRCAYELSKAPIEVKPFYLFQKNESRERKIAVPFRDLALLAKHPIQFYFQKGIKIFLTQEEDRHREWVLSFLQQAVLRNRAFRSGKEGVTLWKRQPWWPRGVFGEVAERALQEEIEKRERCLAEQGVSKEMSTTLEFSPLCDTPFQVREGYWICPSPRFFCSDGVEIVVTGLLEGVSSKGFLFHGEDRWEERIKYWPHCLMLAERQGIPPHFPSCLLSTQSGGAQIAQMQLTQEEWSSFFQKYLNYYQEALQRPSLLMPSWISSLQKGSFEEFEKQRALSLGGSSFTDEWLVWVERMRVWPPLKESFDYWSEYSRSLYPEGLCSL